MVSWFARVPQPVSKGPRMSDKLEHTPPPPPEHLDDWHQHTPEEGVPQAEHAATVNVAVLSFVGVVIVGVVIALVLLVVIYFQAYSSTLMAQKAENTVWYQSEYRPYEAGAMRRLREFGWQDQVDGVVRMPIDQAKARVIESYQNTRR